MADPRPVVRDLQILNVLAQLPGDPAAAGELGGAQPHHEFLAAKAGCEIRRSPAAPLDRVGHGPQHRVTGEVAVGVVVGLEVIESQKRRISGTQCLLLRG
jgi:hypothetical protein